MGNPQHVHEFAARRPGGVETCSCGAFRFGEEYLRTHPPIAGVPPEPPEWITREGYEAIVQEGQSNDESAGGDGSREYVEGYLRQQYLIIGEDKECHDPRLGTPCGHRGGKQCEACAVECDPKYLKSEPSQE